MHNYRYVILIIIVLMLVSCSPIKSKIESTEDTTHVMIESAVAKEVPALPKVDEVPVVITHIRMPYINDYENKTIKLEGISSAKRNSYEGYSIDQMTYLTLEDFCDVARKVNLHADTTKTFRVKDINLDDLTLRLVYKAGRNPMEEIMDSFMNNHELRVDRIVIDGEDKEVLLDLEPFIRVLNGVSSPVLPIYLINSHIYNDRCNLLKVNDTQYKVTFAGIQNAFFHDATFDYSATAFEDYTSSLTWTIDSLDRNYLLSTVVDDKEQLDYETYVDRINHYMIKQQDSHYNIYYTASDTNLVVSDYNIVANVPSNHYTKFLEGFNKLSMSQPEPKWLNTNNFYFPLDRFVNSVNYINYFENAWEDFTVTDGQNKTFILDLRNNLGGDPSYAYHMLEKMGKDKISVRISNMHNQDIYSVNSYYFNHQTYYEDDYDLIILVNEYSMSCSILFTGMLMDNLDAKVIGREPLYKNANGNVMLQLPDGTILSRSATGYQQLNKDYIPYNDLKLIENPMTDSEIDVYLDNFN